MFTRIRFTFYENEKLMDNATRLLYGPGVLIPNNPQQLAMIFEEIIRQKDNPKRSWNITKVMTNFFLSMEPKLIQEAIKLIDDWVVASEVKEAHYNYLVSQWDTNNSTTLVDRVAKTISDKIYTPNEDHIETKALLNMLDSKLQAIGVNMSEVFDAFTNHEIFPHDNMNTHPAFFGWIMGAGMPEGTVAHTLAAMMNLNAGVGNHKIRLIDKQVTDWCKEIFHFPSESAGVLTSGGSMANLTALQPAVHHLQTLHPGEVVRVYTGNQTHGSSQKSIQNLIGRENFIKIPVDEAFRIDISALEQQIGADIAAWYIPGVLIWSLGTTNTGAIDPLAELVRIKEKYNMWLHIDGAYGGPIILTEEFKWLHELFPHFESFALDFHKLLNVNYGVGLSLVRDADKSRKTFGVEGQHYLDSDSDGISGGPPSKDDLGPELTAPPARALSVWMIFKHLWLNGLQEMVETEIAMARYMEEQIREKCSDFLEVVAPRDISVVCFSLQGGDDEDIEVISVKNKALADELAWRGKAVVTTTRLNGKLVIRACVSNYKTRQEHIDTLINELQQVGRGRNKF